MSLGESIHRDKSSASTESSLTARRLRRHAEAGAAGCNTRALYDSDGLLLPSRLDKLRALILLNGSAAQSPLGDAIERSILDLPITGEQTILDLWRGHALRLSRLTRLERLPVRIATSWQAPLPTLAIGDAEMGLTVERDPYDLRGTGGVIRDLASSYADDDFLLVATAAQVILDSFAELAALLEATGGGVTLFAHTNQAPGGLMLIQCACLREIPEAGFIDMKEQALPMIAARHKVSVYYAPRIGLPVRTVADYANAIHVYQRGIRGERGVEDPFSEKWESAGSIVEAGASVDASAKLHDSVVLRGGRVEAGAMLVRSVVCPGALVPRGRTIIDQLVVAGR